MTEPDGSYGQQYNPDPYNSPYSANPYPTSPYPANQPAPYQGYPYPAQQGYPPPGYPPQAWGPPRPTNGMAVASMVLGILWLYWIGSILALIFGYMAHRQIAERGEQGRGMATAGIVLGWIGVGFLALGVLFWVGFGLALLPFS